MRLFYNKTATCYRLGNDTGTTVKEIYKSNGTVACAVMNANPADSLLSEGNPSKSSVMFCDVASDVKDTDKVTIDGVDYIVRGVAKTDGIGLSMSYLKAIIEKLNS